LKNNSTDFPDLNHKILLLDLSIQYSKRLLKSLIMKILKIKNMKISKINLSEWVDSKKLILFQVLLGLKIN